MMQKRVSIDVNLQGTQKILKRVKNFSFCSKKLPIYFLKPLNSNVGPCMNKAFEEGIFRKLYAHGFKQLEAVCEKIWTIYKDEINSL